MNNAPVAELIIVGGLMLLAMMADRKWGRAFWRIVMWAGIIATVVVVAIGTKAEGWW